jgi:hypothetical protein
MADPYVRHDTQLAVGLESDQGTAVTPDRGFGKVDGDTDMPDPSIDWLEERSITGGSQRELTGKYAGQKTYDGGPVPIVPVDGFPLALAFGRDGDGSGGSPVTDTNLDDTGSQVSENGTTLHVIDVLNNAIPPTVTIEAVAYGRGTGNDFVRTFTGAAPPSVTLSVDNESRLQTDLDFVAMGVTEGDSPTSVSADTRDPWIFDDVESDLSLNGNTYCRVTDFEHELTTNVDPRHYICSDAGRDPFEVLYANAEHELSVTVTVVNDDLYNDLLGADDAGDATIQFTKPSNGEVLRYEASNIGIEEAPHTIPEEGAYEVDLTIIPDSAVIKVTDTQTSSAYV